MTCVEIRGLLPLFIYDDLASVEALAVARHLADCPTCQSEHAALAQTRAALDAEPSPIVALDALALVRAESRRQTTRLRRWRRAAITVGALAAGLLLVLALRMEVHAGNGQLVVSFSASRERQVENARALTASGAETPGSPSPELQERLQLLQDLARALAADVANRDDRQQAALVRLRTELEGLQRYSVERWRETDRDVAALYRTAFHHPEPGENP
jgi:hypothetical protein